MLAAHRGLFPLAQRTFLPQFCGANRLPDSTILVTTARQDEPHCRRDAGVPRPHDANLELTKCWWTPAVAAGSVAKAMPRDEAYKAVRENAMLGMGVRGNFSRTRSQRSALTKFLGAPKAPLLNFDLQRQLRYVDASSRALPIPPATKTIRRLILSSAYPRSRIVPPPILGCAPSLQRPATRVSATQQKRPARKSGRPSRSLPLRILLSPNLAFGGGNSKPHHPLSANESKC